MFAHAPNSAARTTPAGGGGSGNANGNSGSGDARGHSQVSHTSVHYLAHSAGMQIPNMVEVDASKKAIAVAEAADMADFSRVITPESTMNYETEEVCSMMNEMLEMRKRWLFKDQMQPAMR
ncbi:hypothetical protein FOA52_001974 [Chlamydomonas sp. UWO 241]|nr:hypothetical protein FOA52_001974 [Chlamydomonas sp. UWO 241]